MKKMLLAVLLLGGVLAGAKQNQVRILDTIVNDDILPGSDNTISLGNGSYQFGVIHSVVGSFANGDVHIGDDMFGGIPAVYSPLFYNIAGERSLMFNNPTDPVTYPDMYLYSTDGSSITLASYVGAGVVQTPNHIRSLGATPTATPTANAGSTGSCSLTTSTDLAGQVTIVTNGSGISSGDVCDITFAQEYVTAPICVISFAGNPPSSVVPYATASTTDLSINFGVAGSASNSFVFNYHCFEVPAPALRAKALPPLRASVK